MWWLWTANCDSMPIKNMWPFGLAIMYAVCVEAILSNRTIVSFWKLGLGASFTLWRFPTLLSDLKEKKNKIKFESFAPSDQIFLHGFLSTKCKGIFRSLIKNYWDSISKFYVMRRSLTCASTQLELLYGKQYMVWCPYKLVPPMKEFIWIP